MSEPYTPPEWQIAGRMLRHRRRLQDGKPAAALCGTVCQPSRSWVFSPHPFPYHPICRQCERVAEKERSNES